MSNTPPLYPLTFTPIYKEKVWGGRKLESLGRTLPDEAAIGESWELVDLGTTSVSGGGGGAERSTVAHGPLQGQTLNALIDTYGSALLGDLPLSADGGFPVLLKYLDANAHLSVQVHPSPAYAQAHDDAYLKSEAWYIVDCEPGAVIYKGIDEGVTPNLFRTALEANEIEAVEPLLLTIPVKPGECHYLPSGTCHALGKGILVAEVQTPSDTTFRVFDWGRVGRELHIEPAMACIDFHPPETEQFEPHTVVQGQGLTRKTLVRCEFFQIEEVVVEPGYQSGLTFDQPVIFMCLEGKGLVTDPAMEAVTAGPGTTVLIPPKLEGAAISYDEPGKWLQVTFPQATSGQIA